MSSRSPLSSDGFRHEVLTTQAAVRALAPAWEAILQQSPCNRAFSSCSWFLAACRAFPDLSPYVLVARRGTTVAGILPLVRTPDGAAALFTQGTDYADLIAPASDTAVLACLLTFARSRLHEVASITLARLRRDANCLRAATLLDPTLGFRETLPCDGTCPYIRLPTTYEAYVASRSKHFRKSLRRKLRQAARHGVTVCERTPDKLSPSQLPDLFLDLHLQRHGDASYFAPVARQQFAQAALPPLFARGHLRVLALYEQDRLLGLQLFMRGADSLADWNGGFLPEAAPWSPGTLLINEGIRRAYAMRLAVYDLLRGTEPYKASWATDAYHTYRLLLDNQP